MKTIKIRKGMLFVALAVVAAIAIYRIGFHIPVSAFNDEAVQTVSQ